MKETPKPQMAPEVANALDVLGVSPDEAQRAFDLGFDLKSLLRKLVAVLLEELLKDPQFSTREPKSDD